MSNHEETWSKSGGQDKDSQVPTELRLAYKEDLEGSRPLSPSKTPGTNLADKIASGQLPDAHKSLGKSQVVDADYQTPAQSCFRPGNQNRPDATEHSTSAAPDRSARSSMIPLWAVDAAIVVVVLGLVITAIRKLVL